MSSTCMNYPGILASQTGVFALAVAHIWWPWDQPINDSYTQMKVTVIQTLVTLVHTTTADPGYNL